MYACACVRVCVYIQLAVFLWNNGAGVRLTDAKFLCGYQRTDAVDSLCSAWLSVNFPRCVCLALHCRVAVCTAVYVDLHTVCVVSYTIASTELQDAIHR